MTALRTTTYGLYEVERHPFGLTIWYWHNGHYTFQRFCDYTVKEALHITSLARRGLIEGQ